MSGLIAAMEEIENGVPVDTEEAAEAAVAVADESAEVQKDSDEIGTTVTQVEDAVQAGDELESISEVAVDAVEEGEGLTEEAAAVASIAIESIRNRLGFRSTSTVVPALESFGNTNTRVMSTKLVIEGIGDSLKKIWAAIKAAALRVWDMIKSFFAKLFNSATMLQKHIRSLKDRAKDIPSSAKPAEKKLKSGIAKQFSVKGKADFSTAKTIYNNTEKMSGVCTELAGKQREISRAAEDLASGEINEASVKKFLESSKAGALNVMKALHIFPQLSGGLASITANLPKGTKKSAKVDHEAYGPFVGNQILLATVTDEEVLSYSVTKVKMSFVGAKEKDATEIEALNANEVKEVLDLANGLANKLLDFKKVQSEYEAITKSTNKVAETVMASADKILNKTGSSTETRQGLDELKDIVNGGIAALGALGNKAPNLQFSCAKALADYASISMRNLKA